MRGLVSDEEDANGTAEQLHCGLHTCLTFDQLLHSPINFPSRLAMITASLQISYLLSATVFISENLLNYPLPEFVCSLKRTIGSYIQEVYDERRLSIDYKHPMLFPI